MTSLDESTQKKSYTNLWSVDFFHKKLTPPKTPTGNCLNRQDLEKMVEAIFENTVLKSRQVDSAR